MHDGRNFLLKVPKVQSIVGCYRYHGAFVHEKLDLYDGDRRLAFVTNVSVDSRLTQAVTERENEKSFFMTLGGS